jgi:glycine/D-amino acid oxidase-like deaminating enzyme
MTEIIQKEGIDCDFWRGFTYGTSLQRLPTKSVNISLDVAMDQPLADDLAALYKEFVDDGGPVDGIVERILDRDQARIATRCPSAVVAYKTAAGSLWPHKLVLHLLKLCIEKHGLNLQTHTPVREVLPSSDGWVVKTDRGDLKTEKVVYATNAFTATLLPEFLGRIWPFKGQCSVVVPTAPYSGSRMLTESYGLAHLVRSASSFLFLPLTETAVRFRVLNAASQGRSDHLWRCKAVHARGETSRKHR